MRVKTVFFAILAGIAIVMPASARVGGYHENEKVGFKVRTPHGWNQIPIQNEERWIVGKFLSDRDVLDKETGFSFKPFMRVIIFPEAVTSERGAKVTKDEATSTTLIEVKNPYKDYEDYLKRNYSGGGWFVSLEEEKKTKDLEWTLMEIKVEKLTSGGKKRLVAGVFHASDADYVVEFEVLEDTYDKVRSTLYGCLKSFSFIARSGSLAPTTSGGGISLPGDDDKLTPKERARKRKGEQEREFEKARSNLPDGWEAFEYKGVYVLTHVDKKYTMDIVMKVLAARDYCEEHFGFISEEYARFPIVRVCANRDEEMAFSWTGSGDAWGGGGGEIVTHKDNSGATGFENEWVFRRAATGWLYDKDKELFYSYPQWMKQGFEQFMGTAYVKSRRLAFRMDEFDKQRMREAESMGKLKDIEMLLTMTGQAFWGEMHHWAQAGELFNFMLEGNGRSMKASKEFFKQYIEAIREVNEIEKKKREESEPEVMSGPTSEEEEDEMFRKRREAFSDEAEKERLTTILDRAFGERDSTWMSLEKAFRAFLK